MDQERLLEALRKGDAALVRTLANRMFITHDMRTNKVEIDAFEKYARCSVNAKRATILYDGKKYVYGYAC